MIKVKNINGNPENKPEGNFSGIHSDNEYFYFFETDQERIEFYNLLPKDIEGQKKIVCDKIDERTRQIIEQGIEFKGVLLSMSGNAQINYLGLPNTPADEFPIPFVSKDDKSYAVVENSEEAFQLYNIAWKKVANSKKSGGALKLQVQSLTNIDDILNFTDPRV